MNTEPLTEDWLREVGFKWHQLERQPHKHWVLWLGSCVGDAAESLGLEVSPSCLGGWHCWFRSDLSHRYGRFIHIRELHTRADLIRLVEAISGQEWNPALHLYGTARSPQEAAKIRADDERLDRQWMLGNPKWRVCEKDLDRGEALPEHLEVATGAYDD